MAKLTEQDKKICKECKKALSKKTSFYASNSFMHPDGYVDICKKCVSDMVNLDDLNSVYMVLQSLDKPFLYDAWEKAKISKTNRNILGLYIGTINMKQHQSKTWKDSVFAPKGKIVPQKSLDESTKDTKSLIDDNKISFWGFGYTDEEYKEFERKYHRLKKNYKEKTEMHTESLKTYVRYRVKEEFATARGDSKEAKAWGELASKAATDAKLNPNQMSKSDVSDGVDVISQLTEIVESYVGVIPIMPRILEQPYDDADMIIWSVVNYSRKLEEKPRVSYRDVYQFYDSMIDDYCKDKNMKPHEIEEYKQKRNNTFRDMELVFQEPLYGSIDEEGFEDE